jgi:hypothetical protein
LGSVVLDGELVAYGPSGRLEFASLNYGARHRAAEGVRLIYVAFDLLAYPGRDLLDRAYRDRSLTSLIERFVGECRFRLLFEPSRILCRSNTQGSDLPNRLSRAAKDLHDGTSQRLTRLGTECDSRALFLQVVQELPAQIVHRVLRCGNSAPRAMCDIANQTICCPGVREDADYGPEMW